MTEYSVIRSDRRTMSLEITAELKVLVRAPRRMDSRTIERFVLSHEEWIKKAVAKTAAREKPLKELSSDEIKELKRKAAEALPKRVEFFSKLTGLTPTSVKITSAKKRFGSCSGKNGICFSLYLMLYPESAIDYVVLHEIAHIKHHNHSAGFWAFVANYMPDYKERRALLRQ